MRNYPRHGMLNPLQAIAYTDFSASGGTRTLLPNGVLTKCSATASSRGSAAGAITGISRGNFLELNLSKETRFYCEVGRDNSDVQAVSRVQIKGTSAEGSLGTIGLGIRADNYALFGESYGSTLGNVDLGVVMTDKQMYAVEIWHAPGKFVRWYVDGDLKGETLVSTEIPSGSIPYVPYNVISIINGAGGGTICWWQVNNIVLWQEP